jgi:hypothetical protein
VMNAANVFAEIERQPSMQQMLASLSKTRFML